MSISVIIPLAPGETEHRALVASLPASMEIITASEGSRARSLNAGAARATGDFFWFLHADSRVSADGIAALERAIADTPEALNYFTLAFGDTPHLRMRINAWGTNMRSRVLGVPFGDQGFCMHRDVFFRLGGFPEHVPYGEDHVWVWRARQQGVRLRNVGATISTSARRYRSEGWLKTTLRFQYLWVKQAWPEWVKLMRMRLKP